ncbi:protein of unknown function DUF214 [Chloroherpeton thalassium ATCC 35110]|uniref:ABC3 transporter permease protein domain-containing protein n=1 Tax=Chloroherpeton thalassium (strain ATCC 35110 / GB-78) TaxID=517418 RepID=B3QSG4_CHLT3|nr:protein of unknown function DUF214 [Chloroherpeton thalassium ATCC 35110]
MGLYDIFRIAFFHLNDRRRQTFLTALGVAIGSAMLITTISVASGSSANIREKIIDSSPHVSVFPKRVQRLIPENLVADQHSKNQITVVEKNVTTKDKPAIKAYTEVVATAQTLENVEAISPFVMNKLIIRNKTRFKSCITRGVVPEREAQVANFEKIITSGSIEELSYTPNGIILGDVLASDLRAKYRSRLDLVTEDGEIFPVIVVGVFQSGFSEFDKKMGYINLRLAQRIEGISASSVTGIGIKTNDINASGFVAATMEKLTGYETESWDETNKNVLDFIKRNNSVTLVLVGFVFIVAGLGVSSVMTTVVLQKTKDIAIMRSYGTSKANITLIFMLEGLFIGVVGALLGSAIGHLICDFVATIRFESSTAGVVRSDRINIVEMPESHIIVVIFAILVTVFSAFGPARRAARLKPVRILRGEVA